jgi:hypothetical protein
VWYCCSCSLTVVLIIFVYSFIKYTRILVHFVRSRKLLLLDMGKCTWNKYEKDRHFIYNSSSWRCSEAFNHKTRIPLINLWSWSRIFQKTLIFSNWKYLLFQNLPGISYIRPSFISTSVRLSPLWFLVWRWNLRVMKNCK